MKRFGLFMLGFAAIVAAGSLAQAAMDEDTDNKFTIHGEVRFRGESWNNLVDFTDTDQGVGANDSIDLFPYRVRLAAKGDLGNDIWVYGEFQAGGVAGGGIFGEVEPIFGDETEFFSGHVNFYQGFVKLKDVGDSSVDLTFGRQEIVFDRGLHFSSLDFYNGISFDGVMAAWEWDDMGLHAFWLRNTENNLTFGQPIGGDSDDNTLGVHWNTMVGDGDKQDVAAYVFYQMQNDPAIDPGQDRGAIYTVGGRWGRAMKGETGLLWNLEGSYQFGDVQPCASPFDPGIGCLDDALDLKATVLEGAIGWNWSEGKTDQKVWGSLFMASGNDDLDEVDPADIELTAFQPLYTDFHNRLGYADLIAPTNVMALSVGYKINLDDRHIFGAQFYDFRKAEENDANFTPLYGGQITPTLADCLGATGEECDNDSIAQELDLTYTYALSNNFSFDTALAYVIPGDAAEDLASGFGLAEDFGDDNAWRIYGQARARW
jgi:hypothetical protein